MNRLASAVDPIPDWYGSAIRRFQTGESEAGAHVAEPHAPEARPVHTKERLRALSDLVAWTSPGIVDTSEGRIEAT